MQWPLDRVLLLAASAEIGSEHPLAKAVLNYAALHLDPAMGGGAQPDSPGAAPGYDSGGLCGFGCRLSA
jgi:cation transport ATPase